MFFIQFIRFLVFSLSLFLIAGCASSPRFIKQTIREKPKSQPKVAPTVTSPKVIEKPQKDNVQTTATVDTTPKSNESNEIAAAESTSEAIAKYSETGLATFYSDKLAGRKTSYGERYDKNQYTAAHKSLPFNTMVRVTNPDNGKTINVRINDRLPQRSNIAIDLSRIAAKELDIIRKGVATVLIEVFE